MPDLVKGLGDVKEGCRTVLFGINCGIDFMDEAVNYIAEHVYHTIKHGVNQWHFSYHSCKLLRNTTYRLI
jgi:hypothetical protein